MDKLVIDIETKNSFADVGGRDGENLKKLEVSFVGAYSYNQNKFFSFHENRLGEVGPFLQKAGLIVGFSINRFDIPVLEKYCSFNLRAIPRLDLLEEIEIAIGQRIGLDILAKSNLGLGKIGQGLEAIKLYKNGQLKELEEYCLNDVKITKELYDLARKQGHLLVPKRDSGETVKAAFNWKEEILPSTLF